MADILYDFTQADGVFDHAALGATRLSYNTVSMNIGSNALQWTTGATETGYLFPFNPTSQNFGASLKVYQQHSWNASISLFLGDFSGTNSGPKGYRARYSNGNVEIIRSTGRYSPVVIHTIAVTHAAPLTLGLRQELTGGGTAILLTAYLNDVAIGSFEDTVSPQIVAAPKAGILQASANSGYVDDLYVSDTYGIDVTDPAVSSVSGTGTSSSTADLTASINEVADVYFYVSGSATPPSEADHLAGAGAAAFDVVLDAPSGVVDTSVTGLTAGAWYLHVIAVDTSDNVSSVVTSSSFALSASLNITGITGTVGYGQTITISAVDLGSVGSVTLSQGVYSDTLEIIDWGGVANTVDVGIPTINESRLRPGAAVLEVINFDGQSDTTEIMISSPANRDVVALTSIAGTDWITLEAGSSEISVGDVVMFSAVLYDGGAPTSYTFGVGDDCWWYVDGAATDGTYSAYVRVWDATDGTWSNEVETEIVLGLYGESPTEPYIQSVTPTSIDEGGTVTIEIRDASPAPTAVAMVTGNASVSRPLTQTSFSGGTYIGTFTAPASVDAVDIRPGSYSLNVTVGVTNLSQSGLTLTCDAGQSYLQMGTPNTTSDYRLQSTPTFVSGDYIVFGYWHNASDVSQGIYPEIDADGVVHYPDGWESGWYFVWKLWDSEETTTGEFWGAEATYTVIEEVTDIEVTASSLTLSGNAPIVVSVTQAIAVPTGRIMNVQGERVTYTYPHWFLTDTTNIDSANKAGTPINIIDSGTNFAVSNGGGTLIVDGAVIGNNYTLILYSDESDNFKTHYVRLNVVAGG